MIMKILKWFIWKFALAFSKIKLKLSLKICNGSVAIAPLCVSICIFDADEFLIAIKLLMSFQFGNSWLIMIVDRLIKMEDLVQECLNQHLILFQHPILLQWISVISLNFCSVLSWLLKQDILKAIWKSWHQRYITSHFPERYNHHSISIGLGIVHFSLTISFWKKYNIYIWCTSIFFLLFSYLASILLWYNYSFLYNFLPTHSNVSIGIIGKWMFEFSEATIH